MSTGPQGPQVHRSTVQQTFPTSRPDRPQVAWLPWLHSRYAVADRYSTRNFASEKDVNTLIDAR